MRINQLKARRADLHTQMKSLRDVVSAGEGRPMTEDERAKFATLEADYDTNDTEIKAEERSLARDRMRQDGLDADQAAAAKASAAAGIPVHNRADDDPMRGFKNHRDFLTAVMFASGTPGRAARVDERLKPLVVRYDAVVGSDEQRGDVGEFGGFFLPEGLSPQLLSLEPEEDPTATRVTPFPMDAAIVNINARVDKNHTTSVSGGLTISRRAETGGFTSSRMSFEQVTLQARSAVGLAYATEEILADSPRSFAAILAAGFRDEYGAFFLNERINGTGSGEPLGVLNAPCLITQAAEVGQGTATIVADNVIKMRSRCWRYGRAVWLANHDIIPQLTKIFIEAGTGSAAIYQPSLREDVPNLLFGRPIFFSEFPATVGTVGDIILGVWSEYLWGTFQNFDQAESMHVRFENHERTFKFWIRNDGAPWWKTVLTPKVSTTTMSPFLALATRS